MYKLHELPKLMIFQDREVPAQKIMHMETDSWKQTTAEEKTKRQPSRKV